jgi:membrane-associated protein
LICINTHGRQKGTGAAGATQALRMVEARVRSATTARVDQPARTCSPSSMAINLRSSRAARLALIVCALATPPTAWLGLRTFRSIELLQSAYAAGASQTSNIRAWMTLEYVERTYRIPQRDLVAALALAPDADPQTSIKALADRARVSPLLYVQKVQRAIGERADPNGREREDSSWIGAIADRTLTALLVYGYPVLGLTLLLGAIGLPLPDGIAATVAGSLAAQGRMNWIWAGLLVVVASVAGDAIGFLLGRLLGREMLARRGGWIGFTATRYARVLRLFERWGSLTIFITRTFVSYLSSVANLFAGVSGYRIEKFIAISAAGRILWTSAYMGLGWAIGADWEAATTFLTNLSLFLLSLTVAVGSGLFAAGRMPFLQLDPTEDGGHR